MESVLEIAETHFAESIAGEMESHTVQAWKDSEGKPVKIYFRRTAPLKDYEKHVAMALNGNTVEGAAEAIIAHCRTEDGKKMFSPRDKLRLMRKVDGGILLNIVASMNLDDVISDDELKKKS